MSRADVTKSEFARTDKLFRKACELAGVQPTPRQASKFRSHKHKGLANQFRSAASLALAEEEKSENA